MIILSNQWCVLISQASVRSLSFQQHPVYHPEKAICFLSVEYKRRYSGRNKNSQDICCTPGSEENNHARASVLILAVTYATRFVFLICGQYSDRDIETKSQC
ncbi:hypothetical protein WA026_010547 [Henosepilachna vigintioctopunctata]|uniref:Uncharacterized protein n=1 Tax=Henosepilachna vigintioctopunctata TaxID=420089 RepID=A0AAW1V5D2_9CUCU